MACRFTMCTCWKVPFFAHSVRRKYVRWWLKIDKNMMWLQEDSYLNLKSTSELNATVALIQSVINSVFIRGSSSFFLFPSIHLHFKRLILLLLSSFLHFVWTNLIFYGFYSTFLGFSFEFYFFPFEFSFALFLQ